MPYSTTQRTCRQCIFLCLVMAAMATPNAPAHAQDAEAFPTAKRLKPLPPRGAVPAIVEGHWPASSTAVARRQLQRYEQELRQIARKHFGRMRLEDVRQAGLDRLDEYDDPLAFLAMINVLADRAAGEKADVVDGVLDRLSEAGAHGQAALAHTAIYNSSHALRRASLSRLHAPAEAPVLQVLDKALRSRKHDVANSAGAIAGMLGAVETIPLLMFSQATRDPIQQKGDLAWIAIETQQPFVAGLAPVVGENAGAFVPIMGVAHEGTVLRVMDAVVVVYRTEIHVSLVDLASRAMEISVDELGYDMKRWWTWYNEEYVPHVNARIGTESSA